MSAGVRVSLMSLRDDLTLTAVEVRSEHVALRAEATDVVLSTQ